MDRLLKSSSSISRDLLLSRINLSLASNCSSRIFLADILSSLVAASSDSTACFAVLSCNSASSCFLFSSSILCYQAAVLSVSSNLRTSSLVWSTLSRSSSTLVFSSVDFLSYPRACSVSSSELSSSEISEFFAERISVTSELRML